MGDSSLRCTLSLAPHSISGDGERFRLVEGIFHVKENQTTVRRELLAGLTTCMTMAYVVIVNPQILS
jgi:AGZA family xanthine/uracil permease-like MFS transporter